MADPKKRLDVNVEGNYYVDSTCINCGTCRHLAPEVFGDCGDYAFVCAQPKNPDEEHRTLEALVCCPTGSVGMLDKKDVKPILDEFPKLIENDVYYCGFTSPKSYGASSYFVKHEGGNWLIDSPKWMHRLVTKFEAMGGIDYIFLSHRDDIADADYYAEKFGSKRIIHEADKDSAPHAEIVIRGNDPIEITKDFLIIPTPGHTKGHQVLLYRSRFLFTGDHLSWDWKNERLKAYRDVCWWSWPEQIKSMKRLAGHRFEWILPGHGNPIKLDKTRMLEALDTLIIEMQRAT